MDDSMSRQTASEPSLSRDIGRYVSHQLRGRRGLIAAAVIVLTPALWFGWPLLVAAGLAPLIIAMAPCAVMCAVGACAMGGNSCKTPGADRAADSAADTGLGSAPAGPNLRISASSNPTSLSPKR